MVYTDPVIQLNTSGRYQVKLITKFTTLTIANDPVKVGNTRQVYGTIHGYNTKYMADVVRLRLFT